MAFVSVTCVTVFVSLVCLHVTFGDGDGDDDDEFSESAEKDRALQDNLCHVRTNWFRNAGGTIAVSF